MLDKAYSLHRLCWTKPIPCIGYVGQNLFLAKVLLDKTYAWQLRWTKSIPGINHAEQNLIWDSVVKIYKTGCFLSIKKNNF